MHLSTNTIDAESVRTETEDSTEYLVAPVVLVRAMELNGGYLPQQEIEASADRWDGEPVPVSHPTAGGEPISIRDDRADTPVIGDARNVEVAANGEELRGEVWIDVAEAVAASQEAARVVNRLQNGDAVEVSTAYSPRRVVSGTFDGEYREQAVLDIEPDHLAVLPNEKGKCSISDGCGAGAPVANQLLLASVAADDPDTTSSNEETGEDAAPGRTMNDSDYTALGRAIAGLTDLVGRGASSETDGPQAANADGGNGGESTDTETTGAESPADSGSDQMGDKTQELVENHGFDAENLPDEDTECFGRIYDTFANEAGGDDETDTSDDDEQTTTTDTEDTSDADEEEYLTPDQAEDLIDSAVEEALAANRDEERKADLVEEIAANTDRDEDDLEDLGVNALEVLAEELPSRTPAANFAAQRGARASSTDDAEEYPNPVANQRAAEQGGD